MKGIFLNVDINTVTFPFLQHLCTKERITEEDLYPFIDQYANTQITDLAINVFCQISMTPSAAWSDALDSYHRKEENGIAVNYEAILGHYHRFYEVEGIDPHEVWFRRCRTVGITPWLSVRMNDCHCPDDTAVWIRGKEFYLSKENGWNIGEDYGYQRYCYDYSRKEIRDRMLAYIEEQLMRYDVDGIELDFSREWHCFREPNTPQARETMTAFVRTVKEITKKAEEKWGHPVKIHFRAIRGIAENHAFGFDIAAMVAEDLLDSVSVAPRWASCDSDMSIESFKQAFPHIPIYAGITDLTLLVPTDAKTAMGYATLYLARGADKIYLYNFFSNPLFPNAEYTPLYSICGSLSTLLNKDRRIVVTYQDMCVPGLPAFVPLPSKADGFCLTVPTGPIEDGEAVSLIVGFDREIDPDEICLSADGKTATFEGRTTYSEAYGKGKNRIAGGEPVKAMYRFSLVTHPAEKGICVTLNAKDESLSVSYLEIVIGTVPTTDFE